MKKNTGFTLIEVLIAMLVLAVGLLGLAGLQATGLSNNQSAYYRSQATQLAYDIADRIRANSSQIATYVANSAGAGVEEGNCLPSPPLPLPPLPGCNPTEMANHDIFEWNDALNTMLGGGVGSIVQTAPGVYTIYVNWDDDKDGSMDNDADGDVDVNDALFTLGFTL